MYIWLLKPVHGSQCCHCPVFWTLAVLRGQFQPTNLMSPFSCSCYKPSLHTQVNSLSWDWWPHQPPGIKVTMLPEDSTACCPATSGSWVVSVRLQMLKHRQALFYVIILDSQSPKWELKSGSNLSYGNQHNQALDFISFSAHVETLGGFSGECIISLLFPFGKPNQGTLWKPGPSGCCFCTTRGSFL
jgi:hypothetical protein